MRIAVVSADAREAEPLLRAARPDVEWIVATTADAVPAGPVDAVFGGPLPRALFQQLSGVRWVQWWAAGVDRADTVPADVVLTRIVDLFSRDMAEYVLGTLIDWFKNFPTARRQQAERRWARYPTRSVAGRVVGIVGAGSIGGGIADLLDRVGMVVYTYATRPRPRASVARAFGAAEWAAFARDLEAIVLVLPLTAETRDFLNRERLAVLPKGVALINVGRGGLVDEEALLEGLGRGRPAHAYLDVVREEPLPPDSPLWTHPAITLTPHVSGPNVLPEIVRYSLENLARWERGEPLQGVVDRARGY